MEKIVLTEFGETLVGCDNSSCTDESKICFYINVHQSCNGFVDLKEVSETHNALLCRCCGLRIVIPKNIDTYGKLRQWRAEQIKRTEKLADAFEQELREIVRDAREDCN